MHLWEQLQARFSNVEHVGIGFTRLKFRSIQQDMHDPEQAKICRVVAELSGCVTLNQAKKPVQTGQTASKEFCNVLAIQSGLDPAGSAGHFQDAVVIEVPLPWKRNMYEKAGVLPQELIDLLALWLERYRAGEPYSHRPLMVAPDPDYSQAGYRRVMFYARPEGEFAHFDKVEYLVPEAELGPLVWELFEAPENLLRYEQYRTPELDATLDLLVCTHGTVDVACAKFGFPLYKMLRDEYANDDLRVWRVSHFGGHVYAPTLMDMPTAHYWAYIERAQAEQIIARTGDVANLRGHYRGWAGLEHGFPQAVERELWQQIGWSWFDVRKSGRVVAQDPDAEKPSWAQVEIEYVTPAGDRRWRAARVECERWIETVPSTGYESTYAYP